MIEQLKYTSKPINEKYYKITYENKDIKQENNKFWNTIKEKGEHISFNYFGDYMIETYKYNNKYYELATNDEIGVRSYIKEYELEGK